MNPAGVRIAIDTRSHLLFDELFVLLAQMDFGHFDLLLFSFSTGRFRFPRAKDVVQSSAIRYWRS